MTTRQLSQSIQGEYAWVVGPESAAGMSLALTRRLPSTLVTGRVEVGASTGFLGRVARRVGSKTTARGGLKLTLAGAELDLGASHQLSDITMGGMHVVAGSQVGGGGRGSVAFCDLWLALAIRAPAGGIDVRRGQWSPAIASL